MRKLAIVLTLLPLLGACKNFGWGGPNTSTLTEEQKKHGIVDVATLANAHESQVFFTGVRQRSDGRNNAFGRDLDNIVNFWDRYFWNYDKDDPYVNYPSNTTKLEHVGRFGLTTLTTVPGVDEITKR